MLAMVSALAERIVAGEPVELSNCEDVGEILECAKALGRAVKVFCI
ncbi:MAG: hypothetical protein QW512_01545 [Thermofilaceae archaeon]